VLISSSLFLPVSSTDSKFKKKIHQELEIAQKKKIEKILEEPCHKLSGYYYALQELLCNTPKTHSDYPNLVKALKYIDDVNKSLKVDETSDQKKRRSNSVAVMRRNLGSKSSFEKRPAN
jgi:hypothetical protein